jgi:hypothetical protein
VLADAATDPATVARALALGIEAADPLAPQSIAVLASAGIVLPGLEDLLRTAGGSGTFRVRVAEALFALTGDASHADAVAAVLSGAPDWYDRMDAAIALAGFPRTPAAYQALTGALDDVDALVRAHAASTLAK